ncbi:MAG: LLM class flavin-dependent oxidoreductase [Gammaproteobacteria bacterium]|nr:LLM class flavin-dependent oxidoreductase [Gammaproteobacteria bacterium]
MDVDLILDARASAAELAALGRLAETAGIRGVWVSSLLDSRDPFTNLSVLARDTERLLLGPVAVNPFDTHPARIAAAWLTLNELASGRARIVIGGGGEALEALDIQPLRRVRAVAECVEIMQAAASAAPVNFSGELYTVRGLRIGWLSAPAPPVFVGASQSQMLRMAARVADGVMMSDMPVALTADALGRLDAALGTYGKARPAFATNAFTAWHVYADQREARLEARRWLLLRGIFRPWLLQTFLDAADVALVMASRDAFIDAFRRGSADVVGVPERVLDALVDNVTLCGSLDQLDSKVEKLSAYAAAGLSAISLRLYAQPADSIRLLGERVVPALRDV